MNVDQATDRLYDAIVEIIEARHRERDDDDKVEWVSPSPTERAKDALREALSDIAAGFAKSS